MSADFWNNKWQQGEIGFHLKEVQPLLLRHWPGLAVGHGSRVLVPLCGKSLDMVFLTQEGHQVVGVELSQIAIRQFLEEQELEAEITVIDGMKAYDTQGIRLVEGDFFNLTQGVTGVIDAVYDRAALIALPPDLQPGYASQLQALTAGNAPVLLITLDYDPDEMEGPPYATPAKRVGGLLATGITSACWKGSIRRRKISNCRAIA